MERPEDTLNCAFCFVAVENSFPEDSEGTLRKFWREFFLELEDGSSSAASRKNFEGGTKRRKLERELGGGILENATVCDSCLPHVESVVSSKVALREMEARVQNLQMRIVKELNGVQVEVDKMCGELGVLEGILERGETLERRRLVSAEGRRTRGRQSASLSQQLKEKVGGVLLDFQRFNGKTSERLLRQKRRSQVSQQRTTKPRSSRQTESSKVEEDEETPPPEENTLDLDTYIKTEISDNDDEASALYDDDAASGSQDNGERDSNDAHSNSLPSPPKEFIQEETWDTPTATDRKVRNDSSIKTKIGRASKHKSINLTGKDSPSEGGTSSNDSDEDFDPADVAAQELRLNPLFKGLSTFRSNIIMSIKRGDTVATGKCKWKSNVYAKDDPRSRYSLGYTSPKGMFSVGAVKIICLDAEEKLKCSECDFTCCHKRHEKCEDIIFEHVLGKHLMAYTCTICGFPSASYNSYRQHTLHHEISQCDICGCAVSSIPETRKRHQWLHLSEAEKADPANHHLMPKSVKHPAEAQERRFQCSTCGKGFKHQRNLKDHESRLHRSQEEREKEICPDCGKVFLQGGGLRVHRRKNCNKQKGVKCLVCEEWQQSSILLNDHMRKVHPHERPYKCALCEKTFNVKFLMRAHLRTHSDNRCFLCPNCGATFKTHSSLCRHQRTKCAGGAGEGGSRTEGGGGGGTVELEQATGNHFNQNQYIG